MKGIRGLPNKTKHTLQKRINKRVSLYLAKLNNKNSQQFIMKKRTINNMHYLLKQNFDITEKQTRTFLMSVLFNFAPMEYTQSKYDLINNYSNNNYLLYKLILLKHIGFNIKLSNYDIYLKHFFEYFELWKKEDELKSVKRLLTDRKTISEGLNNDKISDDMRQKMEIALKMVDENLQFFKNVRPREVEVNNDELGLLIKNTFDVAQLAWCDNMYENIKKDKYNSIYVLIEELNENLKSLHNDKNYYDYVNDRLDIAYLKQLIEHKIFNTEYLLSLCGFLTEEIELKGNAIQGKYIKNIWKNLDIYIDNIPDEMINYPILITSIMNLYCPIIHDIKETTEYIRTIIKKNIEENKT